MLRFDSVMSILQCEYDPRVSIRGTGEGIVLVPGMDGTGELFYRQLPLLEKSYRVATYALRDDAANLETLAADLKRVIEEVAPDKRSAIVMGESFGGAIALTAALTYPQHVSALLILNSFPYFAPQCRLRLALAGLKILPWGAMSLVRYATAFRMHSPHTHRRELKRFIELTAQATREGYINRLGLLRSYDVRARLNEVGCPTLFLAADQDHLVPSLAQARYMADRVPSALVRVLSGHGHICLIAPEIDLCQILAEWRAGTDKSASNERYLENPCVPKNTRV
jgi:pimeloyl-ACP methyl ester carboxylesterase